MTMTISIETSYLFEKVCCYFFKTRNQRRAGPYAGLAVSIRKSNGTAALKRPDGASLILAVIPFTLLWTVSCALEFEAEQFMQMIEDNTGLADIWPAQQQQLAH